MASGFLDRCRGWRRHARRQTGRRGRPLMTGPDDACREVESSARAESIIITIVYGSRRRCAVRRLVEHHGDKHAFRTR
jgi:hypothetical protein